MVLQSPPVLKIWHVQDLRLQQPPLSAALLQHLQGCTFQEWDSRQIAGVSGVLWHRVWEPWLCSPQLISPASALQFGSMCSHHLSLLFNGTHTHMELAATLSRAQQLLPCCLIPTIPAALSLLTKSHTRSSLLSIVTDGKNRTRNSPIQGI